MKKSDLIVVILVLSGVLLAVSAFVIPDLFSKKEKKTLEKKANFDDDGNIIIDFDSEEKENGEEEDQL